jgi:hypothetical protein
MTLNGIKRSFRSALSSLSSLGSKELTTKRQSTIQITCQKISIYTNYIFNSLFKFIFRSPYYLKTPVNFGFVVVPENKKYLIERNEKFHKRLDFGFYALVPFLDRISHVYKVVSRRITYI